MATHEIDQEQIGEEAQHLQRISDVAEEPLEILLPIGGYEDMPIVPLETAVEPLILFLPSVQSYAYVAKMRCKDPPPDGLTIDESASIMLYSMGWQPHHKCLYVALNATLRSTDRERLKPWFLYLKLFLTALSRLPSTHQHVYRGVKLALSEQYQLGKTVIWWGFSSCTTSINVLQSELFLGRTGTRTFFTIDCQSGKDIRNHSYYPKEDEILLLPAIQFKVIGSLDAGNGFHTIQLKETSPPFPLLHPIYTNKSLPNTETKTESTQSIITSYPNLINTDSSASDITNKSVTMMDHSSSIQHVNQDQNVNSSESSSQLNSTNIKDPQQYITLLTKPDMKFGKKPSSSNSLCAKMSYPTEDTSNEKLQDIEHMSTASLPNLLETDTSATSKSDNALFDRLRRLLTTSKASNRAVPLELPTYTNTQLQQMIMQNKNQSCVELHKQNLTNDDMQLIAYYLLQDNIILNTLNLSNNRISDEGVRYLSHALQNNKTLSKLYLSNNQIGAQGAHYLSNVLQTNKTLSLLYLGDNQIGDEGVQYLSQALRNNKTITRLYLSNNQIGDEGILHLSNALKMNKTCTCINLSGNHIGEKSQQILENVKKTNKNLLLYF